MWPWLMIMGVEMVLLFLGAGLMIVRFISASRKCVGMGSQPTAVSMLKQKSNNSQAKAQVAQPQSNATKQSGSNYILAARAIKRLRLGEISGADCSAELDRWMPAVKP